MKAYFIAVVCIASTMAFAKPVEDASAAEAKSHYEQGLVHYNLREYSQAATEFEAAYRLKPDPVFLYNLAQAYRLGDQPDNALHFYRVYLQNSPTAPNRKEVEARIASLEQVIAERKHASDEAAKARTAPPTTPLTTHPTEPAPTPTPTPVVAQPVQQPTVTTTVTDHPKTPVYKKWWLWTIVGVVAAGAAVGIAVGVTSQSHATFDASLGSYGPAALKGGN